jgi:hypothetical protein
VSVTETTGRPAGAGAPAGSFRDGKGGGAVRGTAVGRGGGVEGDAPPFAGRGVRGSPTARLGADWAAATAAGAARGGRALTTRPAEAPAVANVAARAGSVLQPGRSERPEGCGAARGGVPTSEASFAINLPGLVRRQNTTLTTAMAAARPTRAMVTHRSSRVARSESVSSPPESTTGASTSTSVVVSGASAPDGAVSAESTTAVVGSVVTGESPSWSGAAPAAGSASSTPAVTANPATRHAARRPRRSSSGSGSLTFRTGSGYPAPTPTAVTRHRPHGAADREPPSQVCSDGHQ